METARRSTVLLSSVLLLAACGPSPSAIDLRDAHGLGPEGAPVELIVFSDFQCAFCKRAAAEVRRLQKRHPGRLRIHFKHYPLGYHEQAIPAAMAAEAAGLQGRFWEMHDLLFASSGELHAGIYAQLAAELGLDTARFAADMSSAEVARKVAADRADGDAMHLDGTPFFIINKRPFHGSYGELENALFDSDWYR